MTIDLFLKTAEIIARISSLTPQFRHKIWAILVIIYSSPVEVPAFFVNRYSSNLLNIQHCTLCHPFCGAWQSGYLGRRSSVVSRVNEENRGQEHNLGSCLVIVHFTARDSPSPWFVARLSRWRQLSDWTLRGARNNIATQSPFFHL